LPSALRRRGFSLVELLVVMAVLGLLAAAVRPLAEVTLRRERERELKQALWSIRAALDAYKQAADAGAIAKPAGAPGYPPSLAALAQGVPDLQTPGAKRYFLRRVPRDPFMPPDIRAEESWGLRSYASDADNPQPGSDVFDVYSRAIGNGLNGIPLRDW
jgi:general secretion pathway protein G